MRLLAQEIEKIQQAHYRLAFTYPTEAQLAHLANAYKDKTPDELQELYQGFGQIKRVKAMLEAGEIGIGDIPEELRDLFGADRDDF
ncbi:hypothetical protein D3C81_995040 [compost metagenome]